MQHWYLKILCLSNNLGYTVQMKWTRFDLKIPFSSVLSYFNKVHGVELSLSNEDTDI